MIVSGIHLQTLQGSAYIYRVRQQNSAVADGHVGLFGNTLSRLRQVALYQRQNAFDSWTISGARKPFSKHVDLQAVRATPSAQRCESITSVSPSKRAWKRPRFSLRQSATSAFGLGSITFESNRLYVQIISPITPTNCLRHLYSKVHTLYSSIPLETRMRSRSDRTVDRILLLDSMSRLTCWLAR